MFTSQKIRLFVFLSALFLVFATGAQALDSSALLGEGRYFIKTESVIIKKLFGSRHEFDGGFTVELTKGERWALNKIFKIPVREIPFYTINNKGPVAVKSLDNLFNISALPQETGKVVEEKPFEREHKADNQIGWGVKLVYGQSNLKETAGGKDVKIAVLDTGVQIKHPDIVSRIGQCVDFTRGSITTNTCDDENGHGTHTIGVIAADGGSDGKGIYGVAPEAEIWAYKVCNKDGFCWADDVAKAITYATQQGANIITLGFGDSGDFLVVSALDLAQKSNILVVASAGNKGPKEGSLNFPASNQNVIAVGALDEELTVPEWSSRGVNNGDYIIKEGEVELASPGTNIESAWLEGEYRYLSGTSSAAPFVVGLAAKLWDGNALSTRDNIKAIARDVWLPGDDTATGFGLPVLPVLSQ